MKRKFGQTAPQFAYLHFGILARKISKMSKEELDSFASKRIGKLYNMLLPKKVCYTLLLYCYTFTFAQLQRNHNIKKDRKARSYSWFEFLPCDALRCTVFGIVILSVCLSVCPSVCLSVCHTRALCPHGSTYDHDFFSIW